MYLYDVMSVSHVLFKNIKKESELANVQLTGQTHKIIDTGQKL